MSQATKQQQARKAQVERLEARLQEAKDWLADLEADRNNGLTWDGWQEQIADAKADVANYEESLRFMAVVESEDSLARNLGVVRRIVS